MRLDLQKKKQEGLVRRKEVGRLGQEKRSREAWPGEKKHKDLARKKESVRLAMEKKKRKKRPGQEK